ncbi:hypothetical protein EDB89DRAFT_2069309 [Lactarius sanguifluus]|nr:hypothetical protein EDB89DRAFT_2069309 [Lactarius sanguifluus]
MGLEAATKALLDAGNVLPSHRPSPTPGPVHSRPSLVGPGITYNSVEAAFVDYVYGALGTNSVFPDRPSPVRPLLAAAERASPDSERGPPMPRIFGAAPAEYPRRRWSI